MQTTTLSFPNVTNGMTYAFDFGGSGGVTIAYTAGANDTAADVAAGLLAAFGPSRSLDPQQCVASAAVNGDTLVLSSSYGFIIAPVHNVKATTVRS